MKCSVIITNYNYGQFIGKAIESVINQTYKNIEIVVINDGSTDSSLETLYKYYKTTENLKLVNKKNEGQLSAFNYATKYVNGELIFFLDADDMYKKEYIEKIVKVYKEKKDIDFVFCAIERFFSNGERKIIRKYNNNIDLGFSVLSTIYNREWLGGSTSSISMRKKLFDCLLPIPYTEDWITRADDCLVWGSSILGAKKYYFNEPLVLYRVHSENSFYGRQFSNSYLYKRELNINKLFSFFIEKIGGDNFISNLLILEFKSKNIKKFIQLIKYIIILFKMRITISHKFRKFISLLKIYITQNEK